MGSTLLHDIFYAPCHWATCNEELKNKQSNVTVDLNEETYKDVTIIMQQPCRAIVLIKMRSHWFFINN